MTSQAFPPPEMGRAVVALGREGMGPAEIACALGWSRAELAGRAKARPELGEALARARDAALAWWETQARRQVEAARAGIAGLWGAVMAGRFAGEGYGAGRARPAELQKPEPPKREVSDLHRAKALLLILARAYGQPHATRVLDALAEAETENPQSPVIEAYGWMRRGGGPSAARPAL